MMHDKGINARQIPITKFRDDFNVKLLIRIVLRPPIMNADVIVAYAINSICLMEIQFKIGTTIESAINVR